MRSIAITTERSIARSFAASWARKPCARPTPNKNEYAALVEKRFKAADKDNDGTLDKKELNSSAGRALLRLLQ